VLGKGVGLVEDRVIHAPGAHSQVAPGADLKSSEMRSGRLFAYEDGDAGEVASTGTGSKPPSVGSVLTVRTAAPGRIDGPATHAGTKLHAGTEMVPFQPPPDPGPGWLF
jgi:hypothetical protein